MFKISTFVACMLLATSAFAANASYYGKGFAGKRTASGQIFNPKAMTAAHKTLKFGTKVRVTNRRNHKSVIVTITDRGPYIKGRVIDLSQGAALKIDMIRTGVGNVAIEVLSKRK